MFDFFGGFEGEGRGLRDDLPLLRDGLRVSVGRLALDPSLFGVVVAVGRRVVVRGVENRLYMSRGTVVTDSLSDFTPIQLSVREGPALVQAEFRAS